VRRLILLICRNDPKCINSYRESREAGDVQILIGSSDVSRVLQAYKPTFVASHETDYVPKRYIGGAWSPLHKDLSVLLSTSGSLGSPKMVRLSHDNLKTNAEQIVSALQLSPDDRTITTLPLNYAFGLSIINSHDLVKSKVVANQNSVLCPEFWKDIASERITHLYGVPFVFEMLKKAGIFKVALPELRVFAQAGGRMPQALLTEYLGLCKKTDRKFISMYGQTEATARMSYVPWESANKKVGSIGVPVSGGAFFIIKGELVYKGPNVAMGYAASIADLEKGDEWSGRLSTGDLARVDSDGYFYINGRKARFVKIAGSRVGLDELENTLWGAGFLCAVKGKDDLLMVYYEGESPDKFLKNLFRPIHFQLKKLEKLPRSDAGKILYSELGFMK